MARSRSAQPASRWLPIASTSTVSVSGPYLIRLDPIARKGGIKVRRLIAVTSGDYRARPLGLG
ncbi:hypothetical protein GO613_06665 [Azoarcus communis]|nr:hypothetical protein [Parazoarcus communis]